MQNNKTVKISISVLGLLILSASFLHWCVSAGKEPIYMLWAFISAALFAAVCLRFVPHWIDFWSEYKETVQDGFDDDKTCVVIFVSCLAVCFVVLILSWLIKLLSGWQGSFRESLSLWLNLDSRHYLDIARDWYLSEGEWDRLVQLVFFPGYPLLVRFFGLFIKDILYAAFVSSALCFALSGIMMYRLMRLDMTRERALTALKYMCLVPGAFFFAAPMSESLFLCLCLSSVYCARKRKWILAGMLAALAGFTRSLGVMLAVPIIFELIHFKPRGRELRKSVLGVVLIPFGLAAYCLINYQISGDAFKFMEYQRVHWGQEMGWFFNTAAYQLECAVTYWQSGNVKVALGLWGANLLVCFASLIIMLRGVKGLRASYGAYFLCYYIGAIGATWLLSAPRYMAVMFPLPAALSLLSGNKRVDLFVTLILAVLGALYLCAFVLGCQVW